MRWFKRKSKEYKLDEEIIKSKKMLETLIDAYGVDSVLVRQQQSYVKTLERERSARFTDS